jgi:hypothetical protein
MIQVFINWSLLDVIAINRANDASDVVCSDGVTISTAIPSVKDVVVKDIKTVQ